MSEQLSIYEQVINKGLEGVKVCSTSLSTICESKLYIRGYSLEDLVKSSCFSEVSYLLLKGNLPSTSNLKAWNQALNLRMFLDESLPLKELPTENIHPMAWLRTALSLIGLKEEKQNIFHQKQKGFRRGELKSYRKNPFVNFLFTS